jgi:hypothetical protein
MKTEIVPVDPVKLKAILKRSAGGESVAMVIRSLDLPLMETLEALKRFNPMEIKASKDEFRKVNGAVEPAVAYDKESRRIAPNGTINGK